MQHECGKPGCVSTAGPVPVRHRVGFARPNSASMPAQPRSIRTDRKARIQSLDGGGCALARPRRVSDRDRGGESTMLRAR